MITRNLPVTAADLLAMPPWYVIPVEIGAAPKEMGKKIAAVVQVTSVDTSSNRKSISLFGTAWEQNVQVFFQKFWANIISSILHKRGNVDMLVMGRIQDGNQHSRYVIVASSIEFSRNRQSIQSVTASKTSDNEKLGSAIDRVLSATTVHFSDAFEKITSRTDCLLIKCSGRSTTRTAPNCKKKQSGGL